MLAWWNALTLTAQIYAAIAIPATVIMVVQSILLLLGFGADTDIDGDGVPDVDMDMDPDGIGLITIRGIVAFFSVGGWAGYVAEMGKLPILVSVLIALAAGLAALFGVGLLFKAAYKLQGSGNLNIENAIGKTGKVYLPIPPKGEGSGKVSILLQDRLVELDAVNVGDVAIPTGAGVEVCSVADSQTVTVKALNTEMKNTDQGGISKWNLV